MELSTVDIPRAGAREAAAEYRRAAKTITDPAQRAEFEEIARCYRLAAKEDVAMIALTPTIKAGGLTTRTVVYNKGHATHERRENYAVPNLAVCRASAAFCYTRGVLRDGSIEFIDSLFRRPNYRSGVVELETNFTIPEGHREGDRLRGSWTRSAWQATVPLVPPKHRPGNASTLASYVVLWEADDWQWAKVPAPPGDPALLRRVAGDIYAVLATWDLTPLEQMVLAGRRPER